MEEPTRIPRDLAHELRTPLAAVITSLDLITAGEMHLDPTEVTEIVQAAKADAEHLLAVIESARGTGQSHHQVQATVQGEMVRRVLERFPSVKMRTHLRIDHSVTARIDPAALDQILTNLSQNVARYAPEGQVEVRVRAEGAHALVEVADEGPGVADPEGIFRDVPGGSSQGLHLGLSVSRRLAREAGGDLTLAEPIRSGATFRLTLPSGDPAEGEAGHTALAPRARVLVELANALDQRSLPRVEAGLSRIAHDLLATTGVAVLTRRNGWFERAGETGSDPITIPASDRVLAALRVRRPVEVDAEHAPWVVEVCGAERAVAVELDTGARAPAVLVLGLPEEARVDACDDLVQAVTTVAELGVARATLGEEIEAERGLRASVLEVLPIAISVFAGDPPKLIDQNEAERRMLGLPEGSPRPSHLEETQARFDVRFADGTPLTIENAPVTQAIRSGERRGPFHLMVRRADGTRFVSRTYCVPFRALDGSVAGAVVTSEVVDEGPG